MKQRKTDLRDGILKVHGFTVNPKPSLRKGVSPEGYGGIEFIYRSCTILNIVIFTFLLLLLFMNLL